MQKLKSSNFLKVEHNIWQLQFEMLLLFYDKLIVKQKDYSPLSSWIMPSLWYVSAVDIWLREAFWILNLSLYFKTLKLKIQYLETWTWTWKLVSWSDLLMLVNFVLMLKSCLLLEKVNSLLLQNSCFILTPNSNLL